MTTFADMAFDLGGRPLGGGQFTSPWQTHYFVDGTDGSDANDGTAPSRSKATIQAAVTAAGRGDIIYVRPLAYTSDASDVNRYSEAVTVPYATADLSLIGVSNTHHGNPNYGAKLQHTTASGTALTVNAPAFHIENMCVRAEGADYAIRFPYDGTGYTTVAGACGPTMYNVVIRGSLNGVRFDGGYAYWVAKCRFEGGSATDHALYLDGSTDPQRRGVVENCYFGGFNGALNDNAYIRILGATTDWLCRDCEFGIIPNDTHFINATGTNLGLGTRLWFDSADMTLSTGIVKGGITYVGLYDATMVVPAG